MTQNLLSARLVVLAFLALLPLAAEAGDMITLAQSDGAAPREGPKLRPTIMPKPKPSTGTPRETPLVGPGVADTGDAGDLSDRSRLGAAIGRGADASTSRGAGVQCFERDVALGLALTNARNRGYEACGKTGWGRTVDKSFTMTDQLCARENCPRNQVRCYVRVSFTCRPAKR